MEIIKVVVRGELPIKCLHCDFMSLPFEYEGTVCKLMQMRRLESVSERPPWCPLVLTSDLPVDLNGDGWIIDDPDSGWKEV